MEGLIDIHLLAIMILLLVIIWLLVDISNTLKEKRRSPNNED